MAFVARSAAFIFPRLSAPVPAPWTSKAHWTARCVGGSFIRDWMNKRRGITLRGDACVEAAGGGAEDVCGNGFRREAGELLSGEYC